MDIFNKLFYKGNSIINHIFIDIPATANAINRVYISFVGDFVPSINNYAKLAFNIFGWFI